MPFESNGTDDVVSSIPEAIGEVLPSVEHDIHNSCPARAIAPHVVHSSDEYELFFFCDPTKEDELAVLFHRLLSSLSKNLPSTITKEEI
jgi:hypothetical protein